MDDGITYGFSKPDSEDLLSLVGMQDVECEELKPSRSVAILAGLLNADFSGAPATFVIKSIYPLFGAAPDSATLTVANRFGWDAGDADAHIVVIWDIKEQEWVPLQMECPA